CTGPDVWRRVRRDCTTSAEGGPMLHPNRAQAPRRTIDWKRMGGGRKQDPFRTRIRPAWTEFKNGTNCTNAACTGEGLVTVPERRGPALPFPTGASASAMAGSREKQRTGESIAGGLHRNQGSWERVFGDPRVRSP